MSNLLEYINKTSTIESKAKLIFDNILLDYNKGIIKTEVELLYILKQSLKEFYKYIGKPTYKYIPASTTPISSDYNYMIQSANNDMKIILSDCINLASVLDLDFADIELNRTMMNSKINYIDKKLIDIKNKINIDNNSGMFIFTDSFVTRNYMESSLVDDGFHNASINNLNGVLSLDNNVSSNYSSKCKIDILPNSNGFPGNTHIVDVLDGVLHFIGEDGLHMDLNTITDSNLDTWFEYEVFNVNDDIIEKCNNYGFNYKENISWITDETKLSLNLKLTLLKPTKCNWISATPFVPNEKGSKPAFIKSIIISDGDSLVQRLNVNKEFNDNTTIVFTPQLVSFIIIEIEQYYSYNTDIGHYYFTKTNTVSSLIFDDISSTIYSRVDGKVPSIESLNMKYDPSTKLCIHPKNYVDSTGNSVYINESNICNDLFVLPSNTSKTKANSEAIKAHRYFIGIKDISISNYVFMNKCMYVSKPFETSDRITSIVLESEEFIPMEFINYEDVNFKSIGADDWIKYFITLDNGVTWIPINPKHRPFENPSVIQLNSEVPLAIRNTNTIYIDKYYESNSIRLKIQLFRPESYNTMTPIVYNYKLKVLVGGDNIEY